VGWGWGGVGGLGENSYDNRQCTTIIKLVSWNKSSLALKIKTSICEIAIEGQMNGTEQDGMEQ
jgi:hypothetical protein